MRKGWRKEDFGRLIVSDKGWKNYSYLVGDEREAFARLMKSPRLAFLLALFFGYLGAHRFYLGHYRFGLGIALLFLAALLSGVMVLTLIMWVVVLIEIGHIVRTTEQWNDSIEGALVLRTYSKPLVRDVK